MNVYLNDKGRNWDQALDFYNEADAWAKENCPSYQGYEMQDVTDFSTIHDILAMYMFENEEDVLLFTLRWV